MKKKKIIQEEEEAGEEEEIQYGFVGGRGGGRTMRYNINNKTYTLQTAEYFLL